MRSVLVLILLMSACTAAAAAPARHAHPPGWYKFPGRPPIPASENRNLDPSNFGGA